MFFSLSHLTLASEALDYSPKLLIRVECPAVSRAYPRSRWSFGNGTEGTIIHGVSKAAAAAAAAFELIFKQQLKSANVVSAVKMTLLRAPPSRGLTQYHPLSKLTEAAYPAAYAASRCSRHKTAKSLTMARKNAIPRHIQRRWKHSSSYEQFSI